MFLSISSLRALATILSFTKGPFVRTNVATFDDVTPEPLFYLATSSNWITTDLFSYCRQSYKINKHACISDKTVSLVAYIYMAKLMTKTNSSTATYTHSNKSFRCLAAKLLREKSELLRGASNK